jgi:hemerythrin superfamily protein
MTVAPQDDLVSLLAADHAAIKERFAEFDTVGPDARAELFWQLTEQLVRHEVGEEVIVYPELRKLPEGDAVANARVAEEAEAERHLACLEKMDPTSQEFTGSLQKLRGAVLAHAESEEGEVFPLLLAHVEEDVLIQLGQKFKSAKLAAPNHPHPHTPNSATANKLLGPVAALIDRLRDEISA